MKKDQNRLIARPTHHYALLLLLAALVLVFIACVYGFMYLQIGDLVSRSISVDDVVSSRKFDQARAREVQRVFDATAPDRAAAKSLFVPSDGIVPFIESVEAIGASSGAPIEISSIQADDLALADAGTVGSIQLHVDARGSWQSVMRALKMAESMDRAVSIDGVKLFSSKEVVGKTVKVVWALSFDLKALSIAVPQTPNDK